MREIFIIQNVSINDIELKDFGVILSSGEVIELENFDKCVLSEELNAHLLSGTIIRLINNEPVSYEEVYSSAVDIFGFDISTNDASLNELYLQNFSLNASIGRIDSSVAQMYDWNVSQDASILLRPTFTYVDASLNLKVNKSGDTMTGNLILSSPATGIQRDNSTGRFALYGGTGEPDGAYFQITGSGNVLSPGGSSAEFVIGELPTSAYSLFSYDGVASWTQRFRLQGDSGLVTIFNDASVGGTLNLRAGTAAAQTSPLKLKPGTNLTTPEAGSVEFNGTRLYYTDNLATPVRQEVMSAAYGHIYEDNLTSNTTISIRANQWTGWVTASQGIMHLTQFTDNATADRITILNGGDGDYYVSLHGDFKINSQNQDYYIAGFKNGSVINYLQGYLRQVNTNNWESFNIDGIINLVAGDYIDLRFSAPQNRTIEIRNTSITIHRLKRT